MNRFGKKILRFDTVSSTFDKLCEYPPENGLTVTAEVQTGGSGRNGRSWHSPRGGLYFSFYAATDEDPCKAPFLAIVCALAAQKTLSQYVPCSVKWPNDIVAEGRKLCGILTKATVVGGKVSHVMAGVGINVNNTEFDAELKDRAISVKCILKKELDGDKILNSFFEFFESIYTEYPKDRIIEEYKKVCITLGSEVALHYQNGDVLKGRCVDVCGDGTIMVETESGSINVNSGEVSVRGVYGYV